MEASHLDEKIKQKHVTSLIYAMGHKAKDILDSFRLSDDEQKSYTTIRVKFESYFVKKRNIIFDWISFFQRRQEEAGRASCIVRQ